MPTRPQSPRSVQAVDSRQCDGWVGPQLLKTTPQYPDLTQAELSRHSSAVGGSKRSKSKHPARQRAAPSTPHRASPRAAIVSEGHIMTHTAAELLGRLLETASRYVALSHGLPPTRTAFRDPLPLGNVERDFLDSLVYRWWPGQDDVYGVRPGVVSECGAGSRGGRRTNVRGRSRATRQRG